MQTTAITKDQLDWSASLSTLLTPESRIQGTAKYSADLWTCPDCNADKEMDHKLHLHERFEDCDPYFIDSDWQQIPEWTDLQKHIVRTTFMGWGFGCWERLQHQLRYTKLAPEEIHRYVHQRTKLASFDFLNGICLDIDDVARYAKQCIADANPLMPEERRQRLSYTVPQLYWFSEVPGLDLTSEEIKAEIRKAFVAKFGLLEDEVRLARQFYLGTPDPGASLPAEPRDTFNFSLRKDVFTFCQYEYENYHSGVFPLDTNENGVLRHNAGRYCENEENEYMPDSPVSMEEGLEGKRLAKWDRSFMQMFQPEAFKRQKKMEAVEQRVQAQCVENLKRIAAGEQPGPLVTPGEPMPPKGQLGLAGGPPTLNRPVIQKLLLADVVLKHVKLDDPSKTDEAGAHIEIKVPPFKIGDTAVNLHMIVHAEKPPNAGDSQGRKDGTPQ